MDFTFVCPTEIHAFQAKLEEFKIKSQNWTPERIQQELLNNPQFLQAAQQIAPSQNPPNSGLSDQEFSALTEGEKKELASLKSEISQLKQGNVQAVINSQITQRDSQLQTKYSDYNPVEINQAMQQLANMSVADVREFVYKAIRHDDHVLNGYDEAKREVQSLNKERVGAIGLSGIDANTNDSPPTKLKGESDTAYFVRLAQNRLAQSRKK